MTRRLLVPTKSFAGLDDQAIGFVCQPFHAGELAAPGAKCFGLLPLRSTRDARPSRMARVSLAPCRVTGSSPDSRYLRSFSFQQQVRALRARSTGRADVSGPAGTTAGAEIVGAGGAGLRDLEPYSRRRRRPVAGPRRPRIPRSVADTRRPGRATRTQATTRRIGPCATPARGLKRSLPKRGGLANGPGSRSNFRPARGTIPCPSPDSDCTS